MTIYNQQYITQKTKDRSKRNPLETGGEHQ